MFFNTRKIRLLLYPIALIFNLITKLRNIFYDKGIFKSTSFDLPIICIGNLSTGGTGKTPHTEYLIRLLKEKYNIATLSRGYGRKTKGYQLANINSTAETIGDEPMQFYSKFGKEIKVAVNENRVEGVQNLLKEVNPDVVLLDDAFQHRAIQAGFYILLTPYDDLFTNDYVLPAGNLREARIGANRANTIIVTKCPITLNEVEKSIIIEKIRPYTTVNIYFSRIEYDSKIYGEQTIELEKLSSEEVVLITGIANPKPMVDYLGGKVKIKEHLSFPDHYNFTKEDILNINQKSKNQYIITTEKDYMRLQKYESLHHSLYFLPITIQIDDYVKLNKEIEQYLNIAYSE